MAIRLRPFSCSADATKSAGTNRRFTATGLAFIALFAGNTTADSPALSIADDGATLPGAQVTGTAGESNQDIPLVTDTISKKELSEQCVSLLQNALRNVPGITLNAGKGGMHGDSVNLRGLSVSDSFFLDGLRDIAQYQRDTFNDGLGKFRSPGHQV